MSIIDNLKAGRIDEVLNIIAAINKKKMFSAMRYRSLHGSVVNHV